MDPGGRLLRWTVLLPPNTGEGEEEEEKQVMQFPRFGKGKKEKEHSISHQAGILKTGDEKRNELNWHFFVPFDITSRKNVWYTDTTEMFQNSTSGTISS